MKLQLLVPHFSETREEIEPLLNSIALQQNVDFKEIGVIIAFDGPEATNLPEKEWKKRYPFEIKYVKCEKGGVSKTRNAALDAATADYVMFCDADDMFYMNCGLWIIFREMKIGEFDSLVSVFVEETRDSEKNPLYINREMDSTFVHGKVHRRKYLIDKHIRFNDNLTIHEDSYFNILCQSLSENIKYCSIPFYLWKWRDSSVCRHDDKYILKTYNNMLDSNDALIDEFIKRGMADKAMFYTCMMVFDAYYMMNKPEWIDQENKEYRDATELRFRDYFKKHRSKWNTMPPQDKMQISNAVRSRTIGEGMLMEAVTIDDWLKKVLRKKR